MKRMLPAPISGQIRKIFWIAISWTIISLFLYFQSLETMLNFDCNLQNISPIYAFWGVLYTGLLAGIVGGSAVVLLWEKWLRSLTYGVALLYILLSYTTVYVLVGVFSGLYFHSAEMDLPFYQLPVVIETFKHFINPLQINSFLFWLMVVAGTLIILLVNDKYGPGVFLAFLLGKYFHPKREERIFMFLDLRSSTAIAEALGEERYFNFLKEIFEHITPPILMTDGQIYQYVGDEIVVSWSMNRGLNDTNCINCFFRVQQALYERRKHYREKYDGYLPEFKAGLHYGHVMAGEIGVIKRDIIYSGDVLNTTSRIQDKCNVLGVDLLISDILVDKIRGLTDQYLPTKIGEMELRGRQEHVTLYTL